MTHRYPSEYVGAHQMSPCPERDAFLDETRQHARWSVDEHPRGYDIKREGTACRVGNKRMEARSNGGDYANYAMNSEVHALNPLRGLRCAVQ